LKQFYKGFDLISVTDIPDYEAKGYYLRHRKTGLEVFHILNSDEENLFSFSFRTPAADSTGAPHILEHSVFCGSEKFPLREPFVNLMNQSVYTYLNAMTYPDKTVYPASSMNKTDYYHLMDVYSDAVFFPLLRKETFLQEGRRLEVDDKGVYSMQGVVYNEMKGNYSSFSSVAFDEQIRSLQKGSCYENDSGGDPLVIPSLTYEQFRAYHHRYYSPSNCLLFLYGNIPTEEQLDFVQNAVLDRLEKMYPVPDESTCCRNPYEALETPGSDGVMITVNKTGPDSDAKDSSVTVNWRYGRSRDIDTTMEIIYLMQVLAGNDSSPLLKALTDSHLGERPVRWGGPITSSQMVCTGLEGVKKDDALKVKKLIEDTLNRLAGEGIARNDIDAAVLAVDFANREVVRAQGEPFALEIMDRALNGWNYGASPADTLMYRASFDRIKKALASDKDYTEKLIKKILLDNRDCAFVTVSPEKSFLEERNRKERKLTADLSSHSDSVQVKADTDAIHEFQQRKETEEEASCIPHISPGDLDRNAEKILLEESSCPGCGKDPVPLFISREGTNGIVYLDVCFPCDTLTPQDYLYVPLFSSCAMNTGWKGRNWAECAAEAALCCGDMAAHPSTGTVCRTEYAEKAAAAASSRRYIGRDWITFSMKLPVEKADKALSLFSDAISKMDFSDEERIRTLSDELFSGMKSSVLPAGSRYARMRASCRLGRSKAVEELWSGLRQLSALQNITGERAAETGEHFARMAEAIRNAGAVLHITADEKSLEQVLPLLAPFAEKTGLHGLSAPSSAADESFYALTPLPGEKDGVKNEACVLSSQVGYAAEAFACAIDGPEESAAAEVLCHWMRSNPMWEKIRTTGGAYGASAGSDALSDIFYMTSYRDPSPAATLAVFGECLDEACKKPLSDEDLARAVTGTYGEIVQPYSPAGRGYAGFRYALYALTEEDRNRKLRAVLDMTAEKVLDFAKKAEKSRKERYTSLICDKSIKTTGNIAELPL
jgi:Zn-dependent M16 (insulinase) family peptidase